MAGVNASCAHGDIGRKESECQAGRVDDRARMQTKSIHACHEWTAKPSTHIQQGLMTTVVVIATVRMNGDWSSPCPWP
jgi:hypothetical protein